jgi:hypothetical protein
VNAWLSDLREFKRKQVQHLMETGAEIYIAKAFRTLLFRKKLKTLLHWNRFKSAVLIQRVYKGYCVRKKFTHIWSLYKQDQRNKSASVLRIQMMVRRYFAYKKLFHLATMKNKRSKIRQQQKLLFLATISRFNQGRKLYRLAASLWRNQDDYLRDHATVIQRHYRGYHGRQRAVIIRIHNLIARQNKRFTRMIKAVCRIQRRWRGFICR